MKTSNPFIITGYVSPEYFCNRVKETELLKNTAVNSWNNALFSIRKMGKTGLIHHAIHSLKKQKIKCVYFDITTTNSINDFIYEFGKAFFNQTSNFPHKILKTAEMILRGFSPYIVSEPLSGNLGIELRHNREEPVYSSLESLFEYIKKSNDKYLIAIDEFQQILNYPEKNFEAFLRSHIQFLNNTGFIFSGSKKHMLLSIFGDYSRPLWQSCSFTELKTIDKDINSEFIKRNFLSGKKIIEDETIDFIFKTSRGITFYIQLFCNYLFNKNSKVIDLGLANKVLSEIISERESYYLNYINLLTRRNVDLLSAIAKEGGIDKPYSIDFIMKHFLSSSSTIKSAIEVLINKEIIYYDDCKYWITDPLFSEWLKIKDK
jgi:uncharacterized protein